MSDIICSLDSQTNRFPLQARDFLETPEGNTFIKKQAKRACFITVFLFAILAALMMIVLSFSNINHRDPKNVFVCICYCGGYMLAMKSAMALYHQIILNRLNSRLGLSKEERIPLPFQNSKNRIVSGLSALILIIAIIECLV